MPYPIGSPGFQSHSHNGFQSDRPDRSQNSEFTIFHSCAVNLARNPLKKFPALPFQTALRTVKRDLRCAQGDVSWRDIDIDRGIFPKN
jgi:hypothetical protein